VGRLNFGGLLSGLQERYYREKLECHSPAEVRAVVEAYITGLHWVLDYYYLGVSSWTWFYPYHYSPMCSDLVNLDSIEVTFELGTPFFPFQQLLAVLPAASSSLLPKPYKVSTHLSIVHSSSQKHVPAIMFSAASKWHMFL
jgi:5'-3' exoribonuclease 2